jgi:MFS transporter (putative signal transducer)
MTDAIQHADAASPLTRRRLFVVLGGLYLAQGIPTYLFAAALPPILREQGVSRSAIGLMSLLLLPLVLKFLWAPHVDRIRPFARAHRAGWVVITQGGVIAAILSLTLIQPHQAGWIFVVGLILALLLATQDIATDGYAAKHLRPEDRHIGNAIQAASVAGGVIVGGTLGLVLYRHVGWQSMLGMIALISVLPLFAAFAMREHDPPGPRRALDRPSILAFLQRPEAVRVLAVALVFRASEGLVKAMEGAYLVDAGVALDGIGYLSGLGAAGAGLGGAALAAVLLTAAGVRATLALLGGLRTLCFLIFALHAVGAIQGVWPLMGASVFQMLIRYMEIVALYSLFMSVTSRSQPGTDFTILACAQLVVYLVGSTLSGFLADRLGYGAVFALAVALSGAAVLGTAALLRAPPSPMRRSLE